MPPPHVRLSTVREHGDERTPLRPVGPVDMLGRGQEIGTRPSGEPHSPRLLTPWRLGTRAHRCRGSRDISGSV